FETFGQIGDRRRAPFGFDVGERITAEVDLSPQALRFIASLRCRPVGGRPDREPAPAAAASGVVQNKRSRAGGGDADAGAADDVVVVDLVAALGRRQALDHAVAEMSHRALRVLLVSRPLMYGRVRTITRRVQGCQRKDLIFPWLICQDRTKAASRKYLREC